MLLGLAGCTPPLPPLPTPTALPSPLPTLTLAPTPGVLPSPTAPQASCIPTTNDEPGPIGPGAPERNVVGHGHILRGTVRSGADCAPIARAMLELVPADLHDEHHAATRATLFTNADGAYTFECDPPQHIHMRISAPGYRTIYNNSYHPRPDAATGLFDIVLAPDTR